MDKSKSSVQTFNKGFNCAQSVISVFCDELGLDKETALKLTGGFGAGFRKAETCGAVAGAVMVIGFKYGQYIEGDSVSKEKTCALVNEFHEKFISLNGSIVCKDLLSCDISVESNMKYANENGLFETLCPKFVANAVEILEEIL